MGLIKYKDSKKKRGPKPSPLFTMKETNKLYESTNIVN